MGLSRIAKWTTTTGIAALVAAGLTVVPAAEAAADTAPQEVTTPATPPTVSTDVLPTWQVNGVVWSQVVVGNTVFATGAFNTARPAGVAVGGAGEISLANFIAYDITTGERIAKYDHNLNAQGMAVAASPDGTRVYIGGEFTQVDGLWIKKIAAIDVSTGKLIRSFAPQVSGRIRAIAATNSTVYAGGNIDGVSSTSRNRFAAFNASNGALLPWAPTADAEVWSMVLTPDGSKVVAGGQFPNANGSVANGMAAFDPVSGARVTWLANNTIKDYTNGAITSLKTDGTYIYGSGYAYGTGATFEGPFSLNPSDGSIRWLNDCQGDTYDVQPIGPVTYLVGHAHNCLMIDQFPDTNPRVRWQRALAVPSYPTTVNKGPDMYGWNYNGLPAAGLLHWFPDLTAGTVTGQAQAAWSVSGNAQYAVFGGEFPSINGVAQQGLARFAMPTVAPKKRAPQWDTNPVRTVPPVTASTLIPGIVKISFPTAWDQDNKTLTYKVIRDQDLPTRATVAEIQAASNFWTLPMLSASDMAAPDGTHTYSVKISDPDGNAIWSTTSNAVTVAAASALYPRAVVADNPSHYWRLSDSGSTVTDALGDWDGSYASGVSKGQSGALLNESDTAASFNGTSTGYAVTATGKPTTGPTTFSVEAWFKTSSTSGGKIVGWGNATNASSSAYDRHIYINGTGQLTFGIYAGATKTITSGTGYNDGQWHHVVGAVDQSTGLAFYVDGRRIGTIPTPLTAEATTGYWHIGGDTLSSWPSAPSNRYLNGTIDEVAVYPTALTPAQVAAHYTASGRTVPNPTDPTYAFGQAVMASNPTLYWRLDESAGRLVIDTTANGNYGTYSTGGVTYGAAGAMAGSAGVLLNGTSGWLGGATAFVNPTVYSEEIWFKSTSTKGGRLMGFGNASTGTSTSNDRVIFLSATGKVVFGTYTGVENRITSAASFNNGAWHHVVATQGPSGMELYVDGQLVGTNPVTGAQNFTGYWRVGYDVAWTGATSGYLAGTVDDAAVYLRALPASEIRAHYRAGGGVMPNVLPTAVASAATPVGLDVTVSGAASTDEDGTIASYVWNFGDGTVGVTGSPATHRYAAAGTYQVTLTVTDNAGGTGTTTIPVTVTNIAPTATLATAAASRVVTATATAADTDGTIATYEWHFGDGSPVVTGNPATHTYAADGTYQVTLTVTDNAGGTATATGSVTVTNVAPTAHIALTQPTPMSVSVDGSASTDPDGTIAAYHWDFGDGTPAVTEATATHAYPTNGTYQVTLTVTDNVGTTATATHTVVVNNQAPTAALTVSSPSARVIAVDGSASADADGTVAAYSWDFGDGTPAVTGATATHTYAADGTYTVTLTVTDNLGFTGVATHVATVANQAPTAALTVSSPAARVIAVNGSGSTDADGTIAHYSWDFGDGTPAVTGATATHTYAADGTYTVTLTVTDDLGATGAAVYVMGAGNQAPTAVISATSPSARVIAVNGAGSTDVDGTIADYSWDFGDGTPAVTGATATHTYAADGDYTVTLTVTDDLGSTGTATHVVTAANQAPTAVFTALAHQTELTVDAAGSADADGTIAAYTWDFGDGSPAQTGVLATHGYAAAGSYTVTLTVTDDLGAVTTSTQTVSTNNNAPVAAFTASVAARTATLNGTGSTDADGAVAAYSWDFGDGSPAESGATVTHAYAADGDYSVTLTVTDDLGATGTTTQIVTAHNALPTAAFTETSAPQHVEVNAGGSSDADGTITAYSWDFGDGTAAVTGATASHDYAAAGTYTVTLTVTDDLGGTATTSQTLAIEKINDLPTAAFVVSGGELVMGYDGTTSVDPDGTLVSYAWTFGDGTSGSGATVSHTYTLPGTYQVTLTVTDNRGGTATSTQSVWVTGTFAKDVFDRTLALGWGTATQGGAWTVASSSAPFSVAPGLGAMKVNAGQTASAVLASVTSVDTDLSVKLALDKLGTGSGTQVTLIGRGDKSNGYRGKIVVSPTGAMTLSVLKTVSGTDTTITSKAVTGVTYVAGDTYQLRLQVWGTGPTNLRAKVWKVGTTEPTTWLVTGTDTTAAFQVPGSVGVLTYLSASATNAPVTVKYSEFAARLTGN